MIERLSPPGRWLLAVLAVALLGTGCGRKHDGKTIRGWKEGLNSSNEAERRAAVTTLSKIGPAALSYFLSDRPALVKPVWAAASPAPWAENSPE